MLYGKFYPHGLYLFVVSLFRLAIFMFFFCLYLEQLKHKKSPILDYLTRMGDLSFIDIFVESYLF